jgi:acyl-CoA dehydrogenase
MTRSDLCTNRTVDGVDASVTAMMEDVFAAYRESAPPTPPLARDQALWQRLDDLGLVRLTGAEATGGSGAGWPEAVALLSAAVRHGVRIPLAEHDLLACWLLEANDMPCDTSVRTVALLDEKGTATAVPWASEADRVVLVWPTAAGHRVADTPVDAVSITPFTNAIGEPRDTVTASTDSMTGASLSEELLDAVRRKQALLPAIRVSAALDRIVSMSLQHTASRTQFGRPIAKFQTVQNLVSDLAAEAALARSATEAAVIGAVVGGWDEPRMDFLIAVARSCTGHAASVAVRNAHQIHGAIGTTREHRLHEFTRAALAWRSDCGSVAQWDAAVTNAALRAGGAGLWPLITG